MGGWRCRGTSRGLARARTSRWREAGRHNLHRRTRLRRLPARRCTRWRVARSTNEQWTRHRPLVDRRRDRVAVLDHFPQTGSSARRLKSTESGRHFRKLDQITERVAKERQLAAGGGQDEGLGDDLDASAASGCRQDRCTVAPLWAASYRRLAPRSTDLPVVIHVRGARRARAERASGRTTRPTLPTQMRSISIYNSVASRAQAATAERSEAKENRRQTRCPS